MRAFIRMFLESQKRHFQFAVLIGASFLAVLAFVLMGIDVFVFEGLLAPVFIVYARNPELAE